MLTAGSASRLFVGSGTGLAWGRYLKASTSFGLAGFALVGDWRSSLRP